MALKDDGTTCCSQMQTFKVIDVMWAGVIFKGSQCSSCGAKFYNLMDLDNSYRSISNNYPDSEKEECSHEWHADENSDCNVCIKCGARQEIYTE